MNGIYAVENDIRINMSVVNAIYGTIFFMCILCMSMTKKQIPIKFYFKRKSSKRFYEVYKVEMVICLCVCV